MVKLISPAPAGMPGLEFGNTTTRPYNAGRPHRGRDWQWRYANPVVSQRVVAPASGEVISVVGDGSYNQGWGNRVEILIPSSTHRIVSALNHLATGAIAARRGRINAGDGIGQMGATGEAGGVHLHEELWINGVRVDPDYYRAHDLPGTAATPAGNPAGNTIAMKEADMTVAIKLNNAHFFTVGEEFISHNATHAQADITRKVNSGADELHSLNTAQFLDYLDGMGIPRSVVHVDTGRVLNPQTGNFEGNGVWSRRREAVALLGQQRDALAALAKNFPAAGK